MQNYQKAKERLSALYGINCRGEIHVVAEVTKTAKVRKKLQLKSQREIYQEMLSLKQKQDSKYFRDHLYEKYPCSYRNYEGDCSILNTLCPGICLEYKEEGDIND